MHCVRTVTENLYWVGANDHRLTLFENIHPIPKGVSYLSLIHIYSRFTGGSRSGDRL